MQQQVAFLRGINVGNIRIKMIDLKNNFEKLGFKNVETYLQTGNVVYESEQDVAANKPRIEASLSQAFHYEAYVLLYEFEGLRQITMGYPFEREETHHAYVVFVNDALAQNKLYQMAASSAEAIAMGNGVLYWKVTKGESTDTPFAKMLAKTEYKAIITVRNINTLEKMMTER